MRRARAWVLGASAAVATMLEPGAGHGSQKPRRPGRAAPKPAESAPAGPRFPLLAAAGDIACGLPFRGPDHCAQAQTSALILARRPDVVLPLGDLQYDGATLELYRRYYEPTWGRLKSISRPAVGNHEYDAVAAMGYFDYFNGPGADWGPAGERGHGWYSFDVGDWHLVALNSNCRMAGGCHVGSAQETWLRADLAASRKPCTLAYWHHPRFSSGAHGNDLQTAPLWRALQAAGAEVVLSSHDHTYERFAPQDADGHADPAGLRQFVVGTGGKSFYAFVNLKPNSEVRIGSAFGVLMMTLRADGYDWSFETVGGRTRDQGSATCR